MLSHRTARAPTFALYWGRCLWCVTVSCLSNSFLLTAICPACGHISHGIRYDTVMCLFILSNATVTRICNEHLYRKILDNPPYHPGQLGL
jgi:hypothetical protein